MSSPSPRGRWRSLIVLAFGNMIDSADSGLINVLFPAIRSALGLNLETLGTLTAVSRVSRMLFGPLWSMAADRWNRKMLMFLVTGVWGIWTILAGLAQNEFQLLVLYGLGTIGTVAAEPLTTAITADLFPSKDRGRAFGALRAMGGFGFIVFAPLVALLANSADGWRWAMIGLGLVSMLSGVLILLWFQDPGRGASEPDQGHSDRIRRGDLKELMGNPTMWLLAISLVFTTSPIMVSFGVTYLVDVRGFSTAEGTLVLAVFILGYIGSSVIGGWLGDRAQARWGRAGRVALMQGYLVSFAAMSYLCLQISWPHWAYYPLFLTFGLFSALGQPGAFLPILSESVAPNVRSTAIGLLFSFVHGGVTAALSLLVGWLGQTYGLPPAVFWLTTVPYLINVLWWFLFYPRRPPSTLPAGDQSGRR